jgi:hypothetical protein
MRLVRSMHRGAEMRSLDVVTSLAVFSSAFVVAILVLGVVEERVRAALRARIARIAATVEERRELAGTVASAPVDSAPTARVA